MLGKKSLQAAVNVGQDVIDGKNLKQSLKERGKQSLGELALQISLKSQLGSGRIAAKRKALFHSLNPGKKPRRTARKRRRENFELQLLADCSPEQRQFLLMTATPQQMHALV